MGMIRDQRIPSECVMAIDYLNSIKTVFERDGFISPSYLREKQKKFITSVSGY